MPPENLEVEQDPASPSASSRWEEAISAATQDSAISTISKSLCSSTHEPELTRHDQERTKPMHTGARSSTSPPAHNLALERFRACVRKVIHLNRFTAVISVAGAGDEPGVDPRRSSAFFTYGHLHEQCTIEVIDYSSVRSRFRRMDNKEFVEFMAKETKRESWVRVRWINIGGLSWDVLSELALNYDIHPLVLEDIMHQRDAEGRSKADYYAQHLFIRILRHTVRSHDENDGHFFETITPFDMQLHRTEIPTGPALVERIFRNAERGRGRESNQEEDATIFGGSRFSTKQSKSVDPYAEMERGREDSTKRLFPLLSMPKLQRRRTLPVDELKRGERVDVQSIPFFMLLFMDGTVISINRTSDVSFTEPIESRLRRRDTGLRRTADASLLVQSLLDLVVDQAMEVINEYKYALMELEHNILIKPKMSVVRILHVLSGDLTLHIRTFESIRTLVDGIRRYDAERTAAATLGSNTPRTKAHGFISHKSKIYLADVNDHIDYIISNMDKYKVICDNLINYTFNMASYEMNEVMRRLTLVTIIFLPLTLLTGYFGMNFSRMWSVQDNSDAFFWKIAIPVMAVLIPIFTWPDIERMIHYVKKWWISYKFRRLAPAYQTQKSVKKE